MSGVANINKAAGRSDAAGRCAFPSLSQSLGLIRTTAKAIFERAFALDDWSVAECAESAHAEDHNDWPGVGVAIDLLELALDPISARLARSEISNASAPAA